MKRKKETEKKKYHPNLDVVTWHEFENGASETKVELRLNSTLQFILSNRTAISHASIRNPDTDCECKNCGNIIEPKDICLRLNISDGDCESDTKVFFCERCTS